MKPSNLFFKSINFSFSWLIFLKQVSLFSMLHREQTTLTCRSFAQTCAGMLLFQHQGTSTSWKDLMLISARITIIMMAVFKITKYWGKYLAFASLFVFAFVLACVFSGSLWLCFILAVFRSSSLLNGYFFSPGTGMITEL